MIVRDFNKRIPTSIALIVILVLAVVVGSFAYGQYSKMQKVEAGLVRVRIPKKVDFPIDTQEEAVAYAKKDVEVKSFIKEWIAEDSKIHFWADFNEANSLWEVGVYPGEEVMDVWFEIHFDPQGNIIEKGLIEGA